MSVLTVVRDRQFRLRYMGRAMMVLGLLELFWAWSIGGPAGLVFAALAAVMLWVGWVMHQRYGARCEKVGHNWFPGLERREFLPMPNICLRCNAQQVLLPYGHCLGGHPIAEHYDDKGLPVEVPQCVGGPA